MTRRNMIDYIQRLEALHESGKLIIDDIISDNPDVETIEYEFVIAEYDTMMDDFTDVYSMSERELAILLRYELKHTKQIVDILKDYICKYTEDVHDLLDLYTQIQVAFYKIARVREVANGC